MNKIDGWISLHRRVKESSIFMKPSEWFKVWIYLLLEVNHQTGEGFFTWEIIQRDCRTTKEQLKECLKFLEEENMIARKKLPRGVEITIQNWLDYQNKRKTPSTPPSNTPSNTPSEIEKEASNKAGKKEIKNIDTPSNTPSESIIEPPPISTISNNNLLNNLNNKGVNTYIPEHEIFDYWNSKKIKISRSFEKAKSNINSALKLYSEEEIKQAINNYVLIISNLEPNKYWWTHAYLLKDFLSKGLERFAPDNFKESDYLKTSHHKTNWERNTEILSRQFREEEIKEKEGGKNDEKGNDSDLGSNSDSLSED